MLKQGFKKVIFVIGASVLLAPIGAAQTVDGFVQAGYSQGFSFLAAAQLSVPIAQDFTAGTRVEVLYNDGNNNPNDNPKLQVQPFISFETPILSAQEYNLSGGVTLRAFARLFSSVQNATIQPEFDFSVRLQPALNGSLVLAPGWRLFGGTGAGLQFGLYPTQGILYSFVYVYSFVIGDLSSLLPGLEVQVGAGGTVSFSSSFVANAPSVYGNLGFGYQLPFNLRLSLETGYFLGNSEGSYDTPQANGFYAHLRLGFRF